MMLNVVIDGVIFEIQVVLTAMLTARKALDAHKAYNRFRCFSEVFQLAGVELNLPQDTATEGGGRVDAGEQVGEVLSDVAQLQDELQEKGAVIQEKDAALRKSHAVIQEKDAALQEKDASLQEKDAALQEKDAALQEKDAAIARLQNLLAGHVAAWETVLLI